MNNKRWSARHYGSRRGLVRATWYRMRYLFGSYQAYNKIDWSSVERLVFICKGNICRSAFAEAVAHSYGIDAISCGLDTIEDAPANTNAISAAKQLGFDLDGHVTRPIMYLVLKKTDLLIAMEPWQLEFLKKNLCRNHQYTLLGLWSNPILPYIQDPYNASQNYFNKCFMYINESVYAISKKLSNRI